MPAPLIPSSDAARVAALQRLEILDTPPEAPFDELAKVAACVCETPTGLVTLVDAHRQWFKARYGFSVPETDRSISFCTYTIAERSLLEVQDAEQDPRFSDNPLVTGDPHIRFYAGAAIVTPDGHALGSLAVIDYRPRTLTDGQRATLLALANQVVAQIELRRHLAQVERRNSVALERRDHRIAALLDSALDAIVFIDHQGRIAEVNPAAERTFRILRGAAIGQDMAELLIPPRMREDHRRGLAAHLSTGKSHVLGRRIETTAQRTDGSEFPIELTITRLGTEEPAMFAGTLRDMTEQREIDSQLRQSIERFELAVRATQDVIWDWDLRTETRWWSPALAISYGHEPAKLSGRVDSWVELVHPDDRVGVEDSVRCVIERRGVYWSAEYRFRRSDGSFAQVFDRGYITYAMDGQPLRMIGALADMTERRRLEEQLLRSQKLEAVGQLSSGLAHDFNNLLSIIECNAFVLGETADAEAAVCVKDILYASERAAALTRQLLLLGRMQRLRENTVDLNQIVMDMMRILEPTLTARITLTASVDASVRPIRADASMLEQVVLNLVINARDAMERGGTIKLSTSQTTVDTEAVRHGLVCAPGGYACLSVTDSGTGIEPDALPQIFEPFFTTKELGRGTGLGLSTVYHIVKQHRGWIEVSSTVGSGSTFMIALPAVVDAKPRETSRFTATDQPTGTETLLVVEDEPLLRDRIARLLRRYGYTVFECASGPAALEAWRMNGSRIDLVLSDLMMPGGLDGRELVQQLRRDRADLCVIYMSGFSPEHAGQGEVLVDGVNFLEKPYQPIRLLQLIRQQLDHRSPPGR